MSHAEVSALLERWHLTQTRGDFAGYSGLYSSAFHGVRRSRKAVLRFDHDGWLKDRKRMFAKPMTVAMRSVTIGVKGAVASVEFVQSWASGNYSDEGRKRMTIRLEDAAPRILSEELLESNAAPALGSGLQRSFLIFRVGVQNFAVLSGSLATAGEGEASLAGVADDDTVALSRALPASARGTYAPLEGAPVQLVGNGTSCPGKLGAPAAFKFMVPPEGDDALQVVKATPAPSLEALANAAKALWALDSEVYVAATVISGECPGAVVALHSAAAPALILSGEKIEGDQAEPFLSSFDAQPVGRAFAQQYTNYLRDIKDDEPRDPARLGHAQYTDASSQVYRWNNGEKARLATVTWWYPGCAFSTDAFAVTDLGGELQWRDALRGISPVFPLAVFDIEGDGQLEAVVEDTWGGARSLVRLHGSGEVLSSATISVFRCGC